MHITTHYIYRAIRHLFDTGKCNMNCLNKANYSFLLLLYLKRSSLTGIARIYLHVINTVYTIYICPYWLFVCTVSLQLAIELLSQQTLALNICRDNTCIYSVCIQSTRRGATVYYIILQQERTISRWTCCCGINCW